MYACMHICMYSCICISLHVCVHVYLCLSVCMYVHVHMCVCTCTMYVHVCIHMNVCIHVCVHALTSIIDLCKYGCTCMYVHVLCMYVLCTCTCMYVHVCMPQMYVIYLCCMCRVCIQHVSMYVCPSFVEYNDITSSLAFCSCFHVSFNCFVTSSLVSCKLAILFL